MERKVLIDMMIHTCLLLSSSLPGVIWTPVYHSGNNDWVPSQLSPPTLCSVEARAEASLDLSSHPQLFILAISLQTSVSVVRTAWANGAWQRHIRNSWVYGFTTIFCRVNVVDVDCLFAPYIAGDGDRNEKNKTPWPGSRATGLGLAAW